MKSTVRSFADVNLPKELLTLASSLEHPNFNITNFSIDRDDGTYICLVDKAPFAEDQVNL